MPHDPLVLAYLAGAIDADGHITIQRAHRTIGKSFAHHPTYYFPKLGYTSTSVVVPRLLTETFGGSIHQHQPTRSPTHKLVYMWHLGTAQGGAAATALTPYLRQKREQAILVAELCLIIAEQHEHQKQTQKPPYRITGEQLAIRESYWERMTLLNEPSNRRVHFVGKKAAGRSLDGREWNEFPA